MAVSISFDYWWEIATSYWWEIATSANWKAIYRAICASLAPILISRSRRLVKDRCAISGDTARVPLNHGRDPMAGVPTVRAIGEAREMALD